MTYSSGIGSMPGGSVGAETANAADFAEAQRVALGEVSLPHLVEVPGRGAVASMTGRTLGLISELGFDLQPAGWRLAPRGIDQRRAASLIAQDLDVVSQLSVSGTFKVQVCGPWTLAATVEKPKGDLLLSDHGARREVAEALALAISAHVADLRRRLPGVVDLIVQVDEPGLPAVMSGQVPTASGFHRHRSVDPPAASAALELVFGAIAEAGATPIAHCCAADAPVRLLRQAGARGVSVDLLNLPAGGYDPLAESLEAGEWVLLGVVSATDSADDAHQVNTRAHRFLDMLGLDPTERTVFTPACGLAGATPTYARTALEMAAGAAASVSAPADLDHD